MEYATTTHHMTQTKSGSIRCVLNDDIDLAVNVTGNAR